MRNPSRGVLRGAAGLSHALLLGLLLCRPSFGEGAARIIIGGDKKAPTLVIQPFQDHTRARRTGEDRSTRLSDGVREIIASAFRSAGHEVFVAPSKPVTDSRPRTVLPRVHVVPQPDGTWQPGAVSVYVDDPRRKATEPPVPRHAEYEVRGSLSQFGEGFRVQATLRHRHRDAVLCEIGRTADSEAEIIKAGEQVAAELVQRLEHTRGKGDIHKLVARYRGREITYAVAVAALKKQAGGRPFEANMHLLCLYLEKPEPPANVAAVGQACLSAFDPQDPSHSRLAMTLGVDPFLATSDAFIGQGKYADAARTARDGLRLSSLHRVALRLRLGIALRGIGDAKAATACFAEVLRESPKEPQAHLHLAELHEQAGRLDKAIAHYVECLTLPISPIVRTAVRKRLDGLRKANGGE